MFIGAAGIAIQIICMPERVSVVPKTWPLKEARELAKLPSINVSGKKEEKEKESTENLSCYD